MADEQKTNSIGGSQLKPYKTYTYAANTPFYNAVPEPYRQYYMQHVREWLNWYDGFVGWFHGSAGKRGVFSTRVAHSIVDKLSKQITGGRLLFDDPEAIDTEVKKYYGKERNAVDFAKAWSKKFGFTTKTTLAVKYALAAGDSVLKLNNKRGELYPEAIRKDNYFLNMDAEGNITKFSCLIYDMVKQVDAKNDSTKQEYYYIMEERAYADNGDPKARLTIKKGGAKGISYKDTDFHSADVDFNDLTKGQRDELKEEFPKKTFGKWEKLTIKDLGVYMFKASEGVSFNPALPFGESILSNMIHLLMSYDFYYSAKMTDLYLGRGRVLMPRGVESATSDGQYDVMEDMAYERIPYVNPNEQKPEPIQFDLRSQAWTEIRNNLLQEMALQIGINPRSLATFIVPSSEKPSAHEISTDEDETALFVENKRELNSPQINKMFETLLDFYNYNDSIVEVKFSQKGITNMTTLVNQTTLLKQNNLIDDETAVDRLYPDKSEQQKEKILENLRSNKPQTQPNPQEDKTVEEKTEDGYRNGESQVPKPNEESDKSS